MAAFYRIGEFAEKIGVSIPTLRRWDKEGKLKPAKVTDSGARYYSEYQYNTYIGKPFYNRERVIMGYARVSSTGQKDDLERQIENIKTYMYAKGYQFEMITDIGSGINYNKRGLLQLIDRVMSGDVSKVVILYKDRLVRFGYELIEHICEVNQTEIEVIDNTERSEQEELVEDLVQIITVFACRLQGRRSRKTKELIKELKESSIDESQ